MKTKTTEKLFCIFTQAKQISALSLSSYEKCSSPFITFVPLHWTHSLKFMSVLHWGARRLTPHNVLAALFLVQPRMLLATFAIWAHCWHTASLLPAKAQAAFQLVSNFLHC